MKINKWKNLGQKVNNLLTNNTNPCLTNFKVIAEQLGISHISAQRSWNIYKGYISKTHHIPEHSKKDKLIEITKYIPKEKDYIVIEGDIKDLTTQIQNLLLERENQNE